MAMAERPPGRPTRPAWAPAPPADKPLAARPLFRPLPTVAARAAPPAASSLAWLSSKPATLLPPRPAAALPAKPGPARPALAARPAPAAPAPAPWQLVGRPGDHLVLMPGQMHIGQHASSLRTLLGSCVAITLWHPVRRIGGMCHYLLPQRSRRAGEALDGRYGDEAVETMVQTLQGLRAEPKEFVAHLYGGADTLSGHGAGSFNIGERNIEQGWSLIDRYGFALDGVDVGEDVPRTVTLTLATGEVGMRRGAGTAAEPLRDDASARPGPAAASSARFF